MGFAEEFTFNVDYLLMPSVGDPNGFDVKFIHVDRHGTSTYLAHRARLDREINQQLVKVDLKWALTRPGRPWSEEVSKRGEDALSDLIGRTMATAIADIRKHHEATLSAHGGSVGSASSP